MTRRLYSIIIAVLILSSCAYFNTFYNAKRYYKKAYHETLRNRTERLTSSETTNYGKAIEKASKLIRLYPESKYVDDALLLTGKSYYFQKEYHQALRQFDELQKSYPESELYLETSVWIAKCYLELENFRKAEIGFQKLLDKKLPKHLQGDVFFHMARLYEENMMFDKAIDSYKRAMQNDLGPMKAEAAFAIAVDYDSLRQYDKAAEYFNVVQTLDPVQGLQIEAEFRYAKSIKNTGQYEKAIQLFQEMLMEEADKKLEAPIRLEIAQCLLLQGDIDGAMLAYRDIIEEYKRTTSAARAYFELGKIYEKYFQDYDRALDNFDNVKTQSAASAYADTANRKARDIQRLQALLQVINMADEGVRGQLILEDEEVDEDSLVIEDVYTMLDTTVGDTSRFKVLVEIGGEAFADSIIEETRLRERERELKGKTNEDKPEGVLVDWVSWYRDGEIPGFDNLSEEFGQLKKRMKLLDEKRKSDNPDLKSFNVEEKDKNMFLLAELYLFRFALIDSAAREYEEIVEQYPKSEYSARALFNLAYIYKIFHNDESKADSCYNRLIRFYPESSLVPEARNAVDVAGGEEGNKNISTMLSEAETELWDKQNPVGAAAKYRTIIQRFPNSSLQPRAIYALGWIYENRLDSLDGAIRCYRRILQNYPASSYAEAVKPKIIAVDNEQRLMEKQTELDSLELMQPVKKSIADTLTNTLQVDSLGIFLQTDNADNIPSVPPLEQPNSAGTEPLLNSENTGESGTSAQDQIKPADTP